MFDFSICMVQQDTCTKSFQQGCITCAENETHGDIWPFGQEKLIKTDLRRTRSEKADTLFHMAPP